ncbi:P-loop containing nucleoside triphosphate hydrolase [Pleurotus pulmonarius]
MTSSLGSSHISLQPSFRRHAIDTGINDSEDVYIAVMGATGSGKTSFINVASGSSLRVGSGLMSCTDTVQTSEPFLHEGRTVILVDTPGFDDTTKTDTDVLTMIAASLSNMYLRGAKLSGVIYIHRISDFRMGGTSTRNFRMFRELCGDTALQNVVIVTNMWGEVSPDPALDKGAQIKRHDNTSASAEAIIRCIAFNAPLVLCIQRELVDEEKDVVETAAGAELGRELHEQALRYQAERRRLQDELDEALAQQDEEAREELEQATAQLKNDMRRVQIDSERLMSSYSEERERLERRLQILKAQSYQQSEGEGETFDHRDGLRPEVDSGSDEGRMRLIDTLRRLEQQHAEAVQRRSRPRPSGDLRSRNLFLDLLSGLRTFLSSPQPPSSSFR